MLLLIIRTIILYFIIMIALKIMGKRQIGQLQPFELVVILVISEMASISMQYIGVSLLNSIIPIITISILQITLALINLKSSKARRFICGYPTTVIKNGKILEEEMASLRMNVNDLLEIMRSKGFFNLAEVECAIMETNGQLSIMPRSNKRPLQLDDIGLNASPEKPAVTLILDGRFMYDNMDKPPYNLPWLKKKLAEHNINDINQVFFASVDAQGNLFCQLHSKQSTQPEDMPEPIREADMKKQQGSSTSSTIPQYNNNVTQTKE